MRKGKQGNKGITLIALIVTVIVLLILAGITIGALTGDNGIIKEARSSKESAEKAALEEQVEAAIIIAEQKYRNPTLAQVIEEIMKITTVASVEETTGTVTSNLGYVIEGKLDNYLGKTGGSQTPTEEFNTAQNVADAKTQDKPFEKQTTITDSSNKEVIIPAGFKIANDSADTIADGIVIEDSTGNQFVWVPVDDIKEFVRIAGYSNGSQQSLTDYTEPFTNGYSTEANEYNAMYDSVKNNHGFYIGRFEAGKDSAGNVVVKKEANVYNNVPWGNSMNDIEGTSNTEGKVGAVKLAKEFAKKNKYQGITSTLCYGVQWDATLKFIDPGFTGFAKDSSKQGWYSDNYNKTDSGNIETNPSHITGKDLIYSDNLNVVTNKQKNIYDMAGNVWEWVMEARYTSDRVDRGGSYSNDGSRIPASSRSYSFPDTTYVYIGFRVALYL